MRLRNKDEVLAEDMKFSFIKNHMKEGDRLPTERELCDKYEVQRATIRSAFKILEREGIVENRERSGRFMRHSRIPTSLNQVRSFSEIITDLGITPINKLIAFEVFELDETFSAKIHLPIGTEMYKLTRIRSVMHQEELLPIIIEYSYIPQAIAPKILKHDVEERSLFDILHSEYGKKPSLEKQKIEIIYANELEAKLLKVDQMTALVLKEGFTYSQDHELIQYVHVVMNKEWVSFEQKSPRIEAIIKEASHEL
ncbi:MAG: GntR family transcriptional regulator [Eubacteriales bacterium]|nr:GntR family transcriptional regulator [Eubacteriales bacterium]